MSRAALLVCAALAFVACAAAASTPFVAWSSLPSVFSDSFAWGPAYSVEAVVNSQLAGLSQQNGVLVVFRQDELSVEDFSRFGDIYGDQTHSAFKNLQALLESASSTVVVPSLTASAGSDVAWYAANLAKDRKGNVVYTTSESFALARVLVPGFHVVIVTLKPVGGLSDDERKNILNQNDVTVGRVMRILSEAGVSQLSAVVVSEAPHTVELAVAAPVQSSGAQARRGLVGVRKTLIGLTPIGVPANSWNSDYNAYLYFTPPIFMGIFVGLIIVFIALLGTYELMIVQNPDRFASTTDKPLVVPQN